MSVDPKPTAPATTGPFRFWSWSSGDHSARPATYAMNRLAGLVAAVMRGGIGFVGAAAALVGLGPPASLLWGVPAGILASVWSAGFCWFAVRRGLTTWAMATDVALSAAGCLLLGRLVAEEAAPGGSSWVSVTASISLVAAHLVWRPPAAVTAGLAIVAAYLVGEWSAGQLKASW